MQALIKALAHEAFICFTLQSLVPWARIPYSQELRPQLIKEDLHGFRQG